jgi:hypothetical protein
MIVDSTEQCATIEMYIKDVFSKTTNLLEAKKGAEILLSLWASKKVSSLLF